MAKLKVETNKDSESVKYSSLKVGEVFIHPSVGACIKTERCWLRGDFPVNAICLEDGMFLHIDADNLVTYVQKAELELTI